MRFIDRFTRDDVSDKVWWPFTMLLIVLLVLTFPGEHRAIDSRHRDTAAADASLSTRVIAPLVTSAPAGTIAGSLSDQLTEEVRDEILVNDARITAVRIWSADHMLLWSSKPAERLGVANALNHDDIDAAVAAGGGPTWVTTDRSPDNAPSPTFYYSYTSMGSQPLVTQFEYRDSTLTSDVRFAWLGYQIAIGVGLLVSLVFALLSMREPEARIGTGVPFYPESVPKYLAVIDADRAVAIEQAGDRIKERVGSLQHKLDESEEARLRAEGQLQQALAALNTPGHPMPIPQVSPPKREVTPPEAIPVPEPEPIVEVAPEPLAAVAPEPLAAPPAPGAPRKEPPAKPKPRARPKPAAVPAPTPPAPEPAVVAAELAPATPEPDPEPIVVATPSPEPVSVPPVEATDTTEVVIVPELQPAKGAPARVQESAADLLDRLVEPVGPHGPDEDPGDLRARLARTAAIKKPGSKERREADEQQQRH